jgi:hypothetical protein
LQSNMKAVIYYLETMYFVGKYKIEFLSQLVQINVPCNRL